MRRLGRASFFGALGLFAAGALLLTSLPFGGIDNVPAESKATHLARAISEFMNYVALTVPAFVIGAVTWLTAIAVQRRTAGKDA